MNCHATRAVLDLHAEGRLTPGRAKSAEAHLKTCAECRAAAAPLPAPKASKGPGADFKAKLAASLKKEAPAAAAPRLSLWPRDLNGVLWAAFALGLVAASIGWSGAPSQRDAAGDELASGRIR